MTFESINAAAIRLNIILEVPGSNTDWWPEILIPFCGGYDDVTMETRGCHAFFIVFISPSK
jgi:hypothetical protein